MLIAHVPPLEYPADAHAVFGRIRGGGLPLADDLGACARNKWINEPAMCFHFTLGRFLGSECDFLKPKATSARHGLGSQNETLVLSSCCEIAHQETRIAF